MPKTKAATERDALIKQLRPYARNTLKDFENAVRDDALWGSGSDQQAIKDRYQRMRQRMINLLAKIPAEEK